MQSMKANAIQQQCQHQVKASIRCGKAKALLQEKIKKRPTGHDTGGKHVITQIHSDKHAQQRPQFDRYRKGCIRSHRTPAFLKCLWIRCLPSMQPKKPISVVNSRIKTIQLYVV